MEIEEENEVEEEEEEEGGIVLEQREQRVMRCKKKFYLYLKVAIRVDILRDLSLSLFLSVFVLFSHSPFSPSSFYTQASI
jgi:hypothetical protein